MLPSFQNTESKNRKTNSGCQFPDSLIVFGRDDPTRTDDPYVPNVVRYQLRYIPMPVLPDLA